MQIIVFAMLGMLSPASRGALGTCAIFLFVFSGLVAGYFSARLYKTMRGKEWKKAAMLVKFFTLILECKLQQIISDKMVINLVIDSNFVPWNCVWNMFLLKFLYLGKT